MLYLIIALALMNLALLFTIYQQDMMLDRLSDKLYEFTAPLEPVDADWIKWEGKR